MKSLDMRFDKDLIKSWIGKKFLKYECDAFDFTNSVTQIIEIYIGDEKYTLTNIQEKVDYFGNTDDIGILRINKVKNQTIKSAFKDTAFVNTPIEEKISGIKIVNENQKTLVNGKVEYDVWLTRAIIFEIGEREISFVKDFVPFSEEIIIRRGYNLLEKITENKMFLEGWDIDITPKCTRQIEEIK